MNRLKTWLDPKLQERKLSYEDFARLCGLSRASIYFYAADKSRPTEETMVVMCQVLGVPLEEGLSQYTPKKRGRPFSTPQEVRAPRLRRRGCKKHED